MDYQHDDLIEDIMGGTVLSVQSPDDEVNSVLSKNSPYMELGVYTALTHGVRFLARRCADTGSSANFCPETLCTKYKVKVETGFSVLLNLKCLGK